MSDNFKEAFEKTRIAGVIAAGALDEVAKIACPGVKTEEIDTFYETFVDNMAKYEAEDALTVNSLFSFINFEKFKESILLYKKDR